LTGHHHHHKAGHDHPARASAPSLLRMSAVERLAGVLAISGALWILTWWILSSAAESFEEGAAGYRSAVTFPKSGQAD